MNWFNRKKEEFMPPKNNRSEPTIEEIKQNGGFVLKRASWGTLYLYMLEEGELFNIAIEEMFGITSLEKLINGLQHIKIAREEQKKQKLQERAKLIAENLTINELKQILKDKIELLNIKSGE